MFNCGVHRFIDIFLIMNLVTRLTIFHKTDIFQLHFSCWKRMRHAATRTFEEWGARSNKWKCGFVGKGVWRHYGDVIMNVIASQITSLAIVYLTVYSDADQRKHQSSASLAFVRGIHRGPVNSPHKWPVARKLFPFGDVIMRIRFSDFIVGHLNANVLGFLYWRDGVDMIRLKAFLWLFWWQGWMPMVTPKFHCLRMEINNSAGVRPCLFSPAFPWKLVSCSAP